MFVFFASAALALGTTPARAKDVPSGATVLPVTGSVQVHLPGQAAPVAFQGGDKIPQGATIMTGPDSQAFILPDTGTVATLEANTTAELEKLTQTVESGAVIRANTLLNLKAGYLVSTLDPTKRSLSYPGVPTPKGGAAARGTSCAVNVSAGGVSVPAAADQLTFTSSTGATCRIAAGMISTPRPASPRRRRPPCSITSAPPHAPASPRRVSGFV